MTARYLLYLSALAITLLVEVPIVATLYPGQRVRMALACAAASTATHLVLHFVLPLWFGGRATMLVGETQALVLEALAYAACSRPRDLGRGLLASAVANAASFFLGILLFGGPGS